MAGGENGLLLLVVHGHLVFDLVVVEDLGPEGLALGVADAEFVGLVELDFAVSFENIDLLTELLDAVLDDALIEFIINDQEVQIDEGGHALVDEVLEGEGLVATPLFELFLSDSIASFEVVEVDEHVPEMWGRVTRETISWEVCR